MGMNIALDIVTVAHRDDTWIQMMQMFRRVYEVHPYDDPEVDPNIRVLWVDNRVDNVGFAAGCNAGAKRGDAPIIAFFNPDTVIDGPFLSQVQATLAVPGVVITGCRFDKPAAELAIWGVTDWVCGAAMFVKRDWFESIGGFDERFWLFFEETDLIRRAESTGLICRSIALPIRHASPAVDPPADAERKRVEFDRSAAAYYRKWRGL